MRLALVPSAGAVLLSTSQRRAAARRRVGRGDQTRRRRALDFALLLDDEALAEEDVDDVARAVTDAICVRLTSLEKADVLRLVLFRWTRRAARVAALARAGMLSKKHQNTHPPSSPSSVPASNERLYARSRGRSAARSSWTRARSSRVIRAFRARSCAAAGWDTDDSVSRRDAHQKRASSAPRSRCFA